MPPFRRSSRAFGVLLPASPQTRIARAKPALESGIQSRAGMKSWARTFTLRDGGRAEFVRVGLAVVLGRIEAVEAHRLATLDESFQEEFWGTDTEAAARRERIAREVALAARMVALSRA